MHVIFLLEVGEWGIIGEALRKTRAKESRIRQGELKCKAVEREASENPMGSLGSETTLQKLPEFEAGGPSPSSAV